VAGGLLFRFAGTVPRRVHDAAARRCGMLLRWRDSWTGAGGQRAGPREPWRC
jgi:hypothetical protein